MNIFAHVPPGFRFHPTDEELVDYYLRKKLTSSRIDLDIIKDVDLYKIEPWDLQELCRLGTEEQNEWYFFSHKDKKYPTGSRTNRATAAGFWKATGRDKAIYSKHDLIGMRKTLVFYQGRAPNGQKSDWIMHEYRLETDEINATPQEEGWVVCRVFKKRITGMRSRLSDHDSPSSWYDDLDSNSNQTLFSQQQHHFPYPSNSKKDQDINFPYHLPRQHFLDQLPLLDNQKLLQYAASSTINSSIPMASYGGTIQENHVITSLQPSSSIAQEHVQQQNFQAVFGNINTNETVPDQVADWRVLDKFVSSQLISHDQEDVSKQEIMHENASSNSGCHIDMWK